MAIIWNVMGEGSESGCAHEWCATNASHGKALAPDFDKRLRETTFLTIDLLMAK